MKYFLLVKLSSHAVCSAVAVDFCLWRQNVIANSTGAVSPRQVFLTEPEELRMRLEKWRCCLEHFDVTLPV